MSDPFTHTGGTDPATEDWERLPDDVLDPILDSAAAFASSNEPLCYLVDGKVKRSMLPLDKTSRVHDLWFAQRFGNKTRNDMIQLAWRGIVAAVGGLLRLGPIAKFEFGGFWYKKAGSEEAIASAAFVERA